MQLKNFSQFILEGYESLNKKIQFLRLVPVKSYTDNDALVDLTEKASERFYDQHILKEDGEYIDFKKLKEMLENTRPILYYGSKSGETRKFIEEYINENDPKLVYNRPSESEKSGDKVLFHKALEGTDLTPKTVFTIKEAENLPFPIIAKPAEGMSGVGIEKFETLEDLKKSKGKFDLFSEFVDFDREFRGLFVKDNLAVVYERVPIVEDNKSIETKGRDEKLSFVYIEQKNNLPFEKELKEMAKTFNNKIDLDVYSLDFFSKKDGGLSLIEANASSGLGANSLVSVYEALHNDFYDKDIATEDKEFIDGVKNSYNEHIKNDYPKEYKKSLLPK